MTTISKTVEQIVKQLGELVVEVAADAVAEYKESADFVDDAIEYCREAGWREPN